MMITHTDSSVNIDGVKIADAAVDLEGSKSEARKNFSFPAKSSDRYIKKVCFKL